MNQEISNEVGSTLTKVAAMCAESVWQIKLSIHLNGKICNFILIELGKDVLLFV